jgi:hypothetical protein
MRPSASSITRSKVAAGAQPAARKYRLVGNVGGGIVDAGNRRHCATVGREPLNERDRTTALAKTHLEHVYSAVALNLIRPDADAA